MRPNLAMPIVSSVLLAATGFAADFKPNYDESKVPAYTLPDPLVMADGRKVDDAQVWVRQRRPEILDLFRKHVYGRSPGKPADLAFEPFDLDAHALNDKAVRKQVTIRFGKQPHAVAMDLLMYLPAEKRGEPVPVFLILNFTGNHAVHADPGVRLSTQWMRDKQPGVVDHRSTEASRGSASSRYPIEQILARGYGFATIYYGDIDPDIDDGFKNGVHGALDRFENGKRPADAWGSISAWAWGLSRAMDYLEQDRDVDARRVCVLGHSRLGKTALWAGAQDERFAIVISNNSGCGGAALSRRCFGETVGRINEAFPHWFCENFKRYSLHENDLPVDQHMLIGLIAPRPVYVASAEGDQWADPKGEFLSALHADPVYRLLGTQGLPVKDMPTIEHPTMGTIGYHIRPGKHDLTEYDWKCYMEFASDRWPEGKRNRQ